MLRSALIFLVYGCAVLAGADQVADIRGVDVVKTWKELSLQPPVEIRKLASAHFGIQALRAPQYSSVMLYCMTDAYDPADDGDSTAAYRIGPFHLTIKEPGEDEPEKVDLDAEKILHAPGKRDYGRLLFAYAIPLQKLGTHVVELRNSKDVLVASVKVESVEEPFHAWSGLVCGGADASKTNEPASVNSFVLTAAGPASFPEVAGTMPVAYWLSSGVRGPRKFSENDPLPAVPDVGAKEPEPLTPEKRAQAAIWIADLGSNIYAKRAQAAEGLMALGPPVEELMRGADRQTNDAEALLRSRQILAQIDGPFHIRLEGTTVVIRTPMAIPPARVEHFILARWRVNGKPLKFDDTVDGCEAADQPDVPSVSREVRFKLKFSAEALGAKAGDKISLQLLFCPDNIAGDEAHEPQGQESVQEDGESEGENFPDHLPVVSNTIEFKLP